MGRGRHGVLSPHELNMTALFQKVVPDIEAIGSRLGAVAPALLHASANRTPTTRPVQELQAPSLSEGLQTVLQELQLPHSISTSSKGSWWSTADEALAYNGLARRDRVYPQLRDAADPDGLRTGPSPASAAAAAIIQQ